MSIYNDDGSISKSFCISLGIHFGIVTAIFAAPHISELPALNNVASKSIEMSVAGPTQVEVNVLDVAPKAASVALIPAAKAEPVTKDDVVVAVKKKIAKKSQPKVQKKLVKVKTAVKKVAPISAEEVKDYFGDSPVEVEKIKETKTAKALKLDTEIEDQLDPAINEISEPEDTEAIADQSIDQSLKDLSAEEESLERAEKLAQEPEVIKPALPKVEVEKPKAALAEIPKANVKNAASLAKSSDFVGNGSGKQSSVGNAQDGRLLKQVAGNPLPKYPALSRRQREMGTVLLGYYVSKSGVVQNMRVLKSSGHSRLDAEAMKTIARWKFVPGQEGATVHPTTFTLNGIEERMPSRLRTGRAGKIFRN